MPPFRLTLRHFVFCLASFGHLTADKREIKDFPKLPSATSFISKTLSKMPSLPLEDKSFIPKLNFGNPPDF